MTAVVALTPQIVFSVLLASATTSFVINGSSCRSTYSKPLSIYSFCPFCPFRFSCSSSRSLQSTFMHSSHSPYTLSALRLYLLVFSGQISLSEFLGDFLLQLDTTPYDRLHLPCRLKGIGPFCAERNELCPRNTIENT